MGPKAAACRPARNTTRKKVLSMKKTISIVLSAALALSLLSGCGGETPAGAANGSRPTGEDSPQGEDQSTVRGAAAELGSLASFSAGTLDGGTFTQDDVAAKDVTVVNFWALSCGPCIAELPDLAELEQALPDSVQLITVCLDAIGNEEIAGDTLAEAGFAGVTLISGDGDLASLAGNLMYTPTTIFADSEGNLVGDPIIGGQRDLSGTYLEAINQVLTAGGKDEISLEA